MCLLTDICYKGDFFSTHNSLISRLLQHRPEAIIIKYVYPIASTIRNKVVCNTDKF